MYNYLSISNSKSTKKKLVHVRMPELTPKATRIQSVLTDVSSTKMDGSFFSVAITTPLEAAITI